MSENQSRTASDDLYDHEREESRSGRRRRPVADWGVGDDMFEHLPRNRFSRAAEGPPRDRRFSSRAAEADRRSAGEPAAAAAPELPAEPDAPIREEPRDAEPERRERAEARYVDDGTARDDSGRRVREEPRRWTGPDRDDDAAAADEPPVPPRREAAAAQEDVPRGGAAD